MPSGTIPAYMLQRGDELFVEKWHNVERVIVTVTASDVVTTITIDDGRTLTAKQGTFVRARIPR